MSIHLLRDKVSVSTDFVEERSSAVTGVKGHVVFLTSMSAGHGYKQSSIHRA